LLAVAPALAAKKEPPAPPPLPAPDVQLKVEPRVGKPWKIEVVNNGTTPLRITADIRLVRLTIDPPASATPQPTKKVPKPKPPPSVDCVLPSVMRNADRTLLIPAGGKWSDELDPRLHCLDRVDKLIEGATVTARLGWAPPKKGALTPPFAVVPSASVPEIASAKEIAAAAIVLDAQMFPAPSVSAPASASAAASASASASLLAEGGAGRSFAFGKDVETTITIKNVSAESVSIYPRPQSVDARVVNPKGQTIICSGPPFQPAPIIDFVTRLAPKATWSATVPLKGLCPPSTFEQPGLYYVTPILHLPSLKQFGAQAKNDVSGDVTAQKPQLVRVETGDKPFYDAPPKLAK